MTRSFSEIFTEKTNLTLQHFPERTSPPQIHTHVTEKKYMDLLESYNDLRTSYVKYTSELIDQIDRLEQLKDRQIDHMDLLENRIGNLKNRIGNLEEHVHYQDNRYNELLEVIKNYRRMLVERNEFIDKLLNKLNSGFLSRLFS